MAGSRSRELPPSISRSRSSPSLVRVIWRPSTQRRRQHAAHPRSPQSRPEDRIRALRHIVRIGHQAWTSALVLCHSTDLSVSVRRSAPPRLLWVKLRRTKWMALGLVCLRKRTSPAGRCSSARCQSQTSESGLAGLDGPPKADLSLTRTFVRQVPTTGVGHRSLWTRVTLRRAANCD